jgi:hypothetical protein
MDYPINYYAWTVKSLPLSYQALTIILPTQCKGRYNRWLVLTLREWYTIAKLQNRINMWSLGRQKYICMWHKNLAIESNAE